jgi:hypothetical protein
MKTNDLKIAWLVSNLKTNNFSELYETELASTRMRAGVCISGCIKEGYEVLPPNYRDSQNDPSLVFMAKFVADSNTGQFLDDSGKRRDFWLKKIDNLIKKGGKLVLDYTDNHFTKEGVVGDFYREIKPFVSGLVLPSEKMLLNINDLWTKYSYVIPEPVEIDFIGPENKPTKELTALWFGHNSNLSYLFEFMATGLHKAPPKNLIILTNNFPKEIVQEAAKKAPKGMKISLAQWSKNSMIQGAKLSNYALIPSSKNDPRKSGVSPGRLLTSLALGLPVISEPLHSYLPFKDFFIDINTDEAVNLMKDPNNYKKLILSAQVIIKKKYTVDSIQNEWINVVKHFSE